MLVQFKHYRADNRRAISLRARLHLEELEARNLLSVFTPAQIQHAYGFDQLYSQGLNGSRQTIAIVDAYDDPSIGADLQHFDAQFNLPNPNFTKVGLDAFGNASTTKFPAPDHGWASEIALDVEWSHAIAPGANILLVEAASNSFTDLLNAVDYARAHLGVSVVSMSWGSSEFSGEAALDSHFLTPAGHAGITFVASSGDYGAWYGPEWPAVSPNVVSVGGTSLSLSPNGAYNNETGWNSLNYRQYGSTGGYSSYETEPSYQTSVQKTGKRTSPDVAYNANPNTGVYMYDSYNGGWFSGGGTSAGAPQWAGLFALADQGRYQAGYGPLFSSNQTLPALYLMAQTAYSTYYHDVTNGYNGYSAGPGYDLVTGLGTPKAPAVVNALVSARGSGSSITINASASSTTTAKLAKPQLVTQASENPADNTSSSTTNNGTKTGTSTTAVIEIVSVPVVAVAPVSPVFAPVAVNSAAPGNVPVALLSSVPGLTVLAASSSHVGETSPEKIGGEQTTEQGNADEDDQQDGEMVSGVVSRKARTSAAKASRASSDHGSAQAWRDVCTACFAEDAVNAPAIPDEGPALTLDKTGSIAGPMIALAGMVAVLGGYAGTLPRRAEPRKRQRFSLAW